MILCSQATLEREWQEFLYSHSLLENDVFSLVTLNQESQAHWLGIGLTTRCNFECPICYYRPFMGKNTSQPIDFPLDSLIQSIIKMAPVANLRFDVSGEPFLYSHLFSLMDAVLPYVREFSFTTNASLLSAQTITQLQNYPIGTCILSIDGGDKAGYERFRKNGNFEIFCRHAERAVHAFTHRVLFNTVIFKENMETCLALPRLARSLGIQLIGLSQARINECSIQKGVAPCTDSELINFVMKFIEECDKYAVAPFFGDIFAKSSIMETIYEQTAGQYGYPTNHASSPCMVPWFLANITPAPALLPCCGDFELPSLNYENLSFDTVFNHRQMKILRAMTCTGIFPSVCKQSCFKCDTTQPVDMNHSVMRIRQSLIR